MKTYRGFGGAEFSLSDSDYRKLKSNIKKSFVNSPSNFTNNQLERASKARNSQMRTINDEDESTYKMQLRQRTERALEYNVNLMRQQILRSETSKITREADSVSSRSSKSILFSVQNEVNKIMNIDNKYTDTRRPAELIRAMSILTSDVEKAFNEFKRRYVEYMIPALQKAIEENSDAILNTAYYCNQVIGPISDSDSMRIISGCYRELADGRLKPNQIDRYITNKWDTAASINR